MQSVLRRFGVLASIALAVTASAGDRPAGLPVLLKSADLPIPVDAEALQQQFAALSAMPDVQIEYSRLGPVASISGDTGVDLPASVRELKEGASAKVVLDAFRSVLLATGSETLTVRQHRPQLKGWGILLDQSIRGIPVANGVVAVTMDEKTGRVSYLGGAFLPDRNLPTKPALSKKQALQALVRAFEASGDAVAGSVQESDKPRLAYYGVFADAPRPQLVWEMNVAFTCPTGRMDNELVWIDALDGKVAGRRSTISYITSPGPCQAEEAAQADCESEPHPLLGTGPSTSSCQGSSAKPLLVVTRLGCTNSFRILWPRNPGASQYHVVRAPVALGWAFASTVGSGQIHQCTTKVDAPTLVKMRPCDGCGCGEWSEELLMDPQAACEAGERN
jgi:hypothetical protein